MELDEILDCYFEYLVKIMLDALSNADGYECLDFNMLRTEMMININRMFCSRENYQKAVQLLRENEYKEKMR